MIVMRARSVLVVILIVGFVVLIASYYGFKARPRHRIAFASTGQDTEKLTVTLDGANIGESPRAFFVLARIDTKRGDRIFIDVSGFPAMRSRAYWQAEYLQKWIVNGVEVEYFRNGKRLDVHAVTWTDYVDERGEYKYSKDQVTWIIDGIKFRNWPEALSYLKSIRWNADSVLQIVEPVDWTSESEGGIRLGAIDEYLSELATKVVVEFFGQG